MKEAGIEPPEEGMTESLELLGRNFKALLARKLFGEGAQVRVANTHNDKAFAEAMSILMDPTRYNTILGN